MVTSIMLLAGLHSAQPNVDKCSGSEAVAPKKIELQQVLLYLSEHDPELEAELEQLDADDNTQAPKTSAPDMQLEAPEVKNR
jgi:hypothetical protein